MFILGGTFAKKAMVYASTIIHNQSLAKSRKFIMVLFWKIFLIFVIPGKILVNFITGILEERVSNDHLKTSSVYSSNLSSNIFQKYTEKI